MIDMNSLRRSSALNSEPVAWIKAMITNRFGLLSNLFLFAALAACQSAPTVKEDGPLKYDSRNLHDTGEYVYEVRTDSEARISFDIRMSNAANDVNCEKAFIFSSGSVSAAKPSTRHFGFSQMGSPHVALYEWHLCFEVDGVTYKGWRGFDPGPNSHLGVDCDLNKSILDAKETDTYRCRLNSVTTNYENYAEYARRCDATGEQCRRFEAAEELALWKSFHGDVELHEKIALAYFQHELREMEGDGETYLSANPMPVFLNLPGGDPSGPLIRRLKELGLDVHPGSKWQAGKGMTVSISDIEPISDSSVSVTINTYCGPLCASGTTAIFEADDGEWSVISMSLNWIS